MQAIASDLLARALARHGAPGAHPAALATILPRLEGYSWPGNVRELENVLERVAVLFAMSAPSPREAEPRLRNVVPELFELTVSTESRAAAPASLRGAREAQERAHVQRVVGACGGNVAEAARRLGIGRSTLYRKLRCGAGPD